MKRGKLVVIVAPSGTGKSTLIEKLMNELANLDWSVSCTTRPIREGEVHGKNYFFLKEEEFKQKIEDKDLIEWAVVHNNYYGTSKSFVEEGLNNGKNLLFDLDVQGCDQMKAHFGDEAKVIFIEPPSIETLRERLLKRATDDMNVIETRLKNAESELLRSDDFDFKVTNDNFDKAYIDLKQVVEKIIQE
ncbi:MAG: guanylate kinase [Bacteriovoracaceae bacterium]|nr:guanylate kinase [Bacteriovoracaceae bacterium]